jgi:tRNA G18 (ribose-2'-O)-methylase SpoU
VNDPRNVVDEYKGWPHEQIVADLDAHGSALEIAVDNVERDYNMGTIVRGANAFGVRHVHILGRRQWNKRGAMMTDKYLHVHYYSDVDEFMAAMQNKTLIAVDNVAGSQPLNEVDLPLNAVLLFGAEGPGIRPEALEWATRIVHIPQYGSTRSLNVGVAAGIAMYEWTRRHM